MKFPANSKNKSLTTILFLLSIILTIVALIYRKPDAITKQEFWAEDGVIFFQQSYQMSFNGLFFPYAGYLHIIPRLVAILTFYTIGFEHMPLAYNVMDLLIVLGLICFIWFRTKLDPFARFFMILTLSLLPVGSEPVLNITNVQWYTALFIPLLFLTDRVKKYAILDGAVLFLTALTGPFSIIFLPLVCIIMWYRSRAYGQWKGERWLFFVYLLATIIQLSVMIAFSHYRGHNDWNTVQRFAHSGRLNYLQLSIPLGIAKLYTEQTHTWLFALLALGMLGWVFLCWRKFTREKNALPLFLILASLLDAAANVYSLYPSLIPFLNPLNCGTRYFFGPGVLFMWSVFAYSSRVKQTSDTKKPVVRNSAFLLLFAYYAIVVVVTVPSFNFADYNWPQQAKKLEHLQKGHMEIGTNPDSAVWKMKFDK
jgi:hypothetical protein